MSQTIEKSNGNLITINDNAIDTTYSIQLIGKNRPNYGVSINQNFFRLMENFANTTSPLNPQNGQLWWDDAGSLHVFDKTAWKYIGSSTPSSIEPNNPTVGDQWFDLINEQLKIYNGTEWLLVGPTDSSFAQMSGFVTEKITSGSTDYYVASMYANGIRVAILSKDTFSANIANFGNVVITPGINYSSNVSNVATTYGNVSSTTITNAGNLTSGNISVGGAISIVGNATANNISSVNGTFSNINVVSTVNTVNLISTNISGILSTGSQPNITSVGTLGSLTVSGNISAGANISGANISATTLHLNGLPVTLGANDSGGAGFRVLLVPNA